jgi:hypothetical protein
METPLGLEVLFPLSRELEDPRMVMVALLHSEQAQAEQEVLVVVPLLEVETEVPMVTAVLFPCSEEMPPSRVMVVMSRLRAVLLEQLQETAVI